MSSKTRIVVLHMKEVIYTGIFLLLLIILGIVIFFMFGPGKSTATASEAGTQEQYTPGVYRSSVSLNDNTFDVEVTVDQDRIQEIALVNLSESTAAMFPLMRPALQSLAAQIYEKQSLEDLTWADDQKYTSQVLLRAIAEALEKARPR